MADDPQKFLDIALGAVKKAEPIFRQYFGGPTGIVSKSETDINWVTDADKSIEKLIVTEIQKVFPEHTIVGEESAPQETASSFSWFIDPIDGTTNFIRGIPFCVISVGLWDREGPLVAVISNPSLNETYTAIRGQGTFLNGKQIRVSNVLAKAKAVGAIGWGNREEGARMIGKVVSQVGKSRSFASEAMHLCLVASGKLDYLIASGLHIWDVGAGVLLVTEAGGIVTDWDGKPFTKDSTLLIASNGKIQSELLELIQSIR